MIASPYTPQDRRLLAELARHEIDPVDYAEWAARPEIERVLDIRRQLAENRDHDRAREDVRFAIDTLKATIAANKDLADPRKGAEARRAATTIIQIAAAILNGYCSRRLSPPPPRPPRVPRPPLDPESPIDPDIEFRNPAHAVNGHRASSYAPSTPPSAAVSTLGIQDSGPRTQHTAQDPPTHHSHASPSHPFTVSPSPIVPLTRRLLNTSRAARLVAIAGLAAGPAP